MNDAIIVVIKSQKIKICCKKLIKYGKSTVNSVRIIS